MAKAKSGFSTIGTTRTFIKVGTCSETLCNILDRAFEHPLEIEEKAAMPFAGGMMQHGYQCGMLWGATLAAGAQAYRLFGPGPQAQAAAVLASQRLVEAFRAGQNHNINCLEITGMDKSASALKMITYFLFKGGSIGCFRMAARYVREAYSEIDAALSEEQIEAPVPPVSCAALVAQKLGLSDMHTVMAAGFAGGIGLSGGACGALGAVIWIIGLKRGTREDGKVDFKDPRASEMIDMFLKSTDYRFECSRIVGRRFESIDDHAAYLRDGGCFDLLETLATA